MTRSPAQKSLIVSLHDAHPGSQAQIAEQIAFLAERGVTRSSILVVPEFHHGGSVLQDKGFCETISEWQTQGHEIVLHGYFHDRQESPPEKLSTVFWTRLYTNREAEFLKHIDELLEVRTPGATQVLEHAFDHVDVVDLAYKLSSVLPNIVAKKFYPEADNKSLQGNFESIAHAVRNAKVRFPGIDKELWLERRKKEGLF